MEVFKSQAYHIHLHISFLAPTTITKTQNIFYFCSIDEREREKWDVFFFGENSWRLSVLSSNISHCIWDIAQILSNCVGRTKRKLRAKINMIDRGEEGKSIFGIVCSVFKVKLPTLKIPFIRICVE